MMKMNGQKTITLRTYTTVYQEERFNQKILTVDENTCGQRVKIKVRR